MSKFKFITDVKFLGLQEDRLLFKVLFNGHWFDYFQGIGHARKYKDSELKIFRADTSRELFRVDYDSITVFNELDFLYCIKSDAECGNESFSDFCDNLGLSNDSLKALDIYRACEETYKKVRGFEWPKELEEY